MTVEQILAEIAERIATTKEDVERIFKLAPNSYGAGFELGYLQALQELRDYITDVN